MGSNTSKGERMANLAQDSTELLHADERILGVLLFGSAARCQEDENSDLDLLVLYRDQVPEEVLDELDPRVSLSFYDDRRLTALPDRSPLFAIHLAREGQALYDPRGKLAAALARIGPLSDSAASELAASTRRRLRGIFADPAYAPDDLLSAGELYALAKQTALLVSALHGEFVFDRHRALADLADRDRALRADLELVSLLEPAWLSTRPGYTVKSEAIAALDASTAAAASRVVKRLADVGT